MKCGKSNVVANPHWDEVEDALNEELGRAMFGEKSASEALEAAAAKADEILAG